jgi:hypothetical protein
MTVCWNAVPYSLAEVKQRFRDAYCLRPLSHNYSLLISFQGLLTDKTQRNILKITSMLRVLNAAMARCLDS